MQEKTDLSIVGLKVMVLGVEATIAGRFLFQSQVIVIIGGLLVLGGLLLR